MRVRLALLCCAFLLLQGVAVAHEGEGHGKHKHRADVQMAKLHKMMPKYAQSTDRLNAALEKGDVDAVENETRYLLSTTGDLKKSKPHKRLKALKDFKKIAESFEKDVRLTAELARKGDIEGAKASFSDAQKRCTACHTEFRD